MLTGFVAGGLLVASGFCLWACWRWSQGQGVRSGSNEQSLEASAGPMGAAGAGLLLGSIAVATLGLPGLAGWIAVACTALIVFPAATIAVAVKDRDVSDVRRNSAE